MRTPNRVVIILGKADVEEANALLEAEGFGPNNFDVELGDGSFMFSAALQDWEKERIESLLSKFTTKQHDYENDAVNPKEKITDALSKESLAVKAMAEIKDE